MEIGIIGAGKVARSLIPGFINHSKYEPNSITVLGREKTDFSSVAPYQVTCSRHWHDLNSASHIIIASSSEPGAVKETLYTLNKIDPENKIVTSFVSGLSLERIKEETNNKFNPNNTSRATLNVLVAYGQGMIVTTKYNGNSHPAVVQKMDLQPMASLTRISGSITKYITLVGSIPAIDWLWLICEYDNYKKSGGKKSILEYSKGLINELVGKIKTESLRNYTVAKEEASMRTFGVKDLALKTLGLSLKVIVGEKIEDPKIIQEKLIPKVVTPGGSTEKAIGDFHTISDFISCNLSNAFQKMHTRQLEIEAALK